MVPYGEPNACIYGLLCPVNAATLLTSTSVKKTTLRTPFLGGSAILEIVFLTLSLFFIHKEMGPSSNNFYIYSRYGRKKIIFINIDM